MEIEVRWRLFVENLLIFRELVRNMMGLIGNIAEVDDLRKQLMQDEYVEIFW